MNEDFDWLAQATLTPKQAGGPSGQRSYSAFITQARAESLAAEAASYNDSIADMVAEEYCNDHGIYGDGRWEVRTKIQTELDIINDWLDSEENFNE